MKRASMEVRAILLSYILLLCMLILGAYVLWTLWHIITLPSNEAVELGIAVRSAPAILVVLNAPLMLWAIGLSGRSVLRSLIKQYGWLYALVAGCALAVAFSTVWLLADGPYQWGAQDRIVAAVALVQMAVLGVGAIGYVIAAKLDTKKGLG